MEEIQHALQATSNVIELKPGHKYLLIFKGTGISHGNLDILQGRLTAMGIDSLSAILEEDMELKVIEAQGV